MTNDIKHDTLTPCARADDFKRFSEAVDEHIRTYTVNQYGDKGADLLSSFDTEHGAITCCVNAMQKYLARHGRNARGDQQSLDFLKIAHYSQMAWTLSEKSSFGGKSFIEIAGYDKPVLINDAVAAEHARKFCTERIKIALNDYTHGSMSKSAESLSTIEYYASQSRKLLEIEKGEMK